MEILGVLEAEDVPKESMWYALAPSGEAPSPRVGHTCLYVPASDAQGKGKVVIVGGADPGCCYSDAHIINLDTYEWDNPGWKDLLPRYEHACFTSASDPTTIWVFGGAEQAENRNSIQVIRPESCSWKNPNVEGPCPSPRTFHTSCSAIGDKFYVFGGGEKGAEPAADNKLHVFDTSSLTWTQPVISGNPPKPRHGHIITAVGTKLFIHGGMAGSSFFSDMFCIDTDTMKWKRLKMKGDLPPACAAHSSISWKKFIYIFGGMTETGPISTMYRFDTEEHLWAQMKFDSPSPPARLDHSMCMVPWKTRKDTSAEDHESQTSVPICLIFGGMDTAGELFNDCYVTALQE
ncbi:rab9 effector protein with kelch motifs isoform X1 [Bufo gargarizans]|uniref:rab9 effector protein with kelch motifs isoform X1 n=1 Tax=Bufo gargarizans TaxID=30331 RepID=UPI001CF1A55D|nr:rab9 effector protein with kelch motifs isoform X1 [Bufo gargarizans]XP_044161132.1 rab9 effector protein with kelch motifs isoform X1 [Bufo gargarizans]XP_044161133.1 rab9 effector protein with kelch motifs isoform X1 [Bufo gargarizans]XP_044161134.1 rab9 effector protein with kelch motifs isoform X1 [Bufo gargarizans]